MWRTDLCTQVVSSRQKNRQDWILWDFIITQTERHEGNSRQLIFHPCRTSNQFLCFHIKHSVYLLHLKEHCSCVLLNGVTNWSSQISAKALSHSHSRTQEPTHSLISWLWMSPFCGWEFSNKRNCAGWRDRIVFFSHWTGAPVLPPVCWGRRLEEGRAGGPTCQQSIRNHRGVPGKLKGVMQNRLREIYRLWLFVKRRRWNFKMGGNISQKKGSSSSSSRRASAKNHSSNVT